MKISKYQLKMLIETMLFESNSRDDLIKLISNMESEYADNPDYDDMTDGIDDSSLGADEKDPALWVNAALDEIESKVDFDVSEVLFQIIDGQYLQDQRDDPDPNAEWMTGGDTTKDKLEAAIKSINPAPNTPSAYGKKLLNKLIRHKDQEDAQNQKELVDDLKEKARQAALKKQSLKRMSREDYCKPEYKDQNNFKNTPEDLKSTFIACYTSKGSKDNLSDFYAEYWEPAAEMLRSEEITKEMAVHLENEYAKMNNGERPGLGKYH